MDTSSESLSYTYTTPPISPEQFRPITPSQLLFDMYADRIADYPGFRQRTFLEARDDFESTFHEADQSMPTEQLKSLIQTLICPESYDELLLDLESYWNAHALEKGLETHSYVILTNHRFFSDLPILGTILRDLRRHDPHAAKRGILIAGRMIPGMEIDLFGSGEFTPVTPMLRWIFRQLQNVPSVPESATEGMEAQRRIWHDELKSTFSLLSSVPGNIFFIAASGTHDAVTPDKSQLIMHSVSPALVDLLVNPRIRLIPAFFSCDSFSQGVHPAKADFRFLQPRTATSAEEVHGMLTEIAAAGSDLLQNEFPRGVVYNPSLRKKFGQLGHSLLQKLSSDS